MKNVRTYIILVIIGLLPINAFSAQTNFGNITKIKAFGSQAYVWVDGLNDPNQCNSTPTGKVRLYWTTENSDRYWSLLLAAQMSGKKVSFDGTCVSSLLSINAVWLES